MNHRLENEIRKYAAGLETALAEAPHGLDGPASRGKRRALTVLVAATVVGVLAGMVWLGTGMRNSQEVGTGGPATTEIQAGSASCADVEAFSELLGVGRAIDYQPTYSVEHLRSTAELVVDGGLVAVSEGSGSESRGYASVVLALEDPLFEPDEGAGSKDRIEIEVSASALVSFEEYAEAAPLGARVVAFVDSDGEGRYQPYVEGLWFGCGPEDTPVSMMVSPSWTVTSLDELRQ